LKAHHHAQLAVRMQNTRFSARCLSDEIERCLVCLAITAESVFPLELSYVKCA
jgi:hypothetical protein